MNLNILPSNFVAKSLTSVSILLNSLLVLASSVLVVSNLFSIAVKYRNFRTTVLYVFLFQFILDSNSFSLAVILLMSGLAKLSEGVVTSLALTLQQDFVDSCLTFPISSRKIKQKKK
jgi:hypothetical protein